MKAVELTEGGIRVGDRTLPLLEAEFHYFRNEAGDWPLILDRVRDAGFPIVNSFVQWNWHETAPGEFDFEGRTVPERDLPRFLRLCGERELGVHLRTSPACCEWRVSGASSHGTPWRVAFDAFWSAVAPYRASEGGALWLLQVHNEWSDLVGTCDILRRYNEGVDGFREPPVPYWLELSGMNAHYRAAGNDFDPGLLARHMEDRYGEIGRLNRRWETGFASFEELAGWLRSWTGGSVAGFLDAIDRRFRGEKAATAPPAMLLDLLDAFRLYMAYALRDDVEFVRERCDLPLTHNWAMGDGDAFDRRAGLDLSGYDMYAPTAVKAADWVFTMADLQGNRLPYAGEFMCGLIERPIWGGQGRYTPEFARMEILSWFALGLRGVSLYMFVERDSWRHCPVDRRGGVRPSWEAISGIVHGLRDAGVDTWRRRFDLRVVKFLPYHEAASDAPEAHFDRGYSAFPWLKDFLYGAEDPKRSFFDLFHGLLRTQIDFEVFKVEPEGRDPAGVPVLLVYAMPWIDRRLAERVDAHVRAGGVAIFYPHLPAFDMEGAPLEFFRDLPAPSGPSTLSGGIEETEINGEPRVLAEIEEQAVRSVKAPVDADRVVRIEGKTVGYRCARDAGRVIVLGFDPARNDEILRVILEEWAGARVYARADGPDAGASLFETGGGHAVIAFNGGKEPAAVRVPGLAGGGGRVRDLLGNAETAAAPEEGGAVARVGPRDGILLMLEPGQTGNASLHVEGQRRAVPVDGDWRMFVERESDRAGPFAVGNTDPDRWAEVPAEEWTLPALASGKVLGVQGWFRLRAEIECESPPREIRLRPRCWQNLGVVSWDRVRLGTYACERPGMDVRFEIPDSGRSPGSHVVSIRLFRPTLECHDVGSSGFEGAEVVCDRTVHAIESFLLLQERRDTIRPPAEDSEWQEIRLPWEGFLRRGEDRLWLQAVLPTSARGASRLRLSGKNAVVTVAFGSHRLASTPYLPVDLPIRDGIPEDATVVTLRIDPDADELDFLPRDRRFDAISRAALDPVEVRIDPPSFL